RGENFSFSLKSAHSICVTRELIRQNFNRDVTLQFRVTCAIDLAHSALTEKGCDFERAKPCTYIYRHWNITGDAKTAFRGIMPRSDKGSKLNRGGYSSDGPESFHRVMVLVLLHMPGKPRCRKLGT